MNLDLLVNLLRQTCTIHQVRDTLRALGASPRGATWDLLIEDLKAKLKSGRVKASDLLALLEESEEHGNQHVFLYTADPKSIEHLFVEKAVRGALKAAKAPDVIGSPLLLDRPAKRTIAQIRWDTDDRKKVFILKQVMKHEHHELASSEEADGEIVRRYTPIEERMVDVMCVTEDGVVEARLGRRKSVSSYDEYLEHFWNSMTPFLSFEGLKQTSLSKAKNYLLQNSAKLKDLVRYHTSTLQNDYGYTAKFATGTHDDDLVSDNACKSGVDAFYKNDGHCNEVYISFKKKEGVPSRDLRVRISGGHVNEFILTQRCDRPEYEYVIEQLRRLNK